MSIQIDNSEIQHTLHSFDGDLKHLHTLKLEMAQLVAFQLNQAMQALDEGDMELAKQIILRDYEINQYEIKIDTAVLNLLAKHCPVANDLRMVISTSKIVVELEKIGDEIVEFAKLILVLYNPNTSDPNPHLLEDIFKISGLIKNMLDKILVMMGDYNVETAYRLLADDRDCENNLQEGIKHQLSSVIQDARLIGRALDILQIMKSLERCGEYCRNIAEYMIFMIDGTDVRHINPHQNTNAC